MKKNYLLRLPFPTVLTLLVLVLNTNLSAQDAVTRGKELFGDLKARHIGPAIMSGRITDLEPHPTNNRIIYTGTAGGGVWKSNNGGATFNSVFDDYCQSIGAVTVDPSQPETVWVGTGETWTRNSVSIGDGLYKSADGGSTWKHMGFEKSERIAGIQVNPNNSNEVYVAVLGALWSDSNERGLYKTLDGGVTWQQILFVNGTTGCSDLVIDPKNVNTLYASFWEVRRTPWSFNSGGLNSALYKSTDAGKTWNKIHNGFPKGKLGRIAIGLAPSNTNIIYAVLETELDKDKGLYRSDDAGATWKHVNGDFGLVVRPFYFSRIVVDPKNPEVVVKAGLYGSISRDGGKTFKNLGPMHADIHDIIFDINNSDRMYVGTDGGIYRTWDGGTTMEIVENLPVSQFYQISVDNEEPYNVYGGLQDNGSWYGPSSSPGGVEARDWNVVGVGDGYRVLRHPTKKIIYSEMQGAQNVWRYDPAKDLHKTIQPLAAPGDPKLRFNWNSPMAVSLHQPDRFYMGSQFVHRSEDMGDTWVKISPDLTTNDKTKINAGDSGGLSKDNSGAENHCTIFTITESPLDENIIWAGTDDGNVQVTRDGGKTWQNVTANIPGLPKNTSCWHIEASVFGKGNAYAVFTGYQQGDMKPYAYKTTDYGATWTSIISPDVTSFVRNIQEDYVNENLLFLGTELGLYVTLDGGKSWMKFTNNVPAVSVHFIDLHKKTNDLILGTHGRGVIIIDDISPLRELSEEALNKELHFFTRKPSVITETNGFGGTASETQFVGANASQAAKIVYYLKKRHTIGKMSLEIHDKDGNLITELNPGKSKGINIIEWNYATKAPKTAAGKTFTFGGFTAPRAPAGTYKVVLQKGKETYTTDLTVQYSPNSTVSTADRELQQSTTRKLFTMTEDLAYLVYELDELLSVSEKLKAKSPSAGKSNAAFESGLLKLKETLLITTGDNYVAAGNPQLREDLSELYAKVASSFFGPSAAELANMKALEERFEKAKTTFASLKTKHGKNLENQLMKNGLEPVSLKPFGEFVKLP